MKNSKNKTVIIPKNSIIITINEKGELRVSGFPQNRNKAEQIMFGAQSAISQYFIQHAIAGKLDGNGNITNIIAEPAPSPSNIIKLNDKENKGNKP